MDALDDFYNKYPTHVFLIFLFLGPALGCMTLLLFFDIMTAIFYSPMPPEVPPPFFARWTRPMARDFFTAAFFYAYLIGTLPALIVGWVVMVATGRKGYTPLGTALAVAGIVCLIAFFIVSLIAGAGVGAGQLWLAFTNLLVAGLGATICCWTLCVLGNWLLLRR